MSDPHITTGPQASPTHVTTDAHHGGHGHHAPGGHAALFTDAQLHSFHEDDKHAGGAVIVLMSAIFSIGLALYTVVAYVVAQ